MIITNRVALIPFTEEHYQAIFKDNNIKLGELLNITTPQAWTGFSEARKAINALYDIFISLNNDARWGSYFIILQTEKKLIGTCGFKGKPDNNNCVEIGYEINTSYQNKGFATEVSKALIDFTFKQKVAGIKAHTLADENASARVLRKCNFKFTGEFNDPEDGMVWSWYLGK